MVREDKKESVMYWNSDEESVSKKRWSTVLNDGDKSHYINDEKLTIVWIQILKNSDGKSLIEMGLRENRRRWNGEIVHGPLTKSFATKNKRETGRPWPGSSVGWGIILYTRRLQVPSGHIPRLWVWAPVGSHMAPDWCFPLTLMFLSKSIIYI